MGKMYINIWTKPSKTMTEPILISSVYWELYKTIATLFTLFV